MEMKTGNYWWFVLGHEPLLSAAEIYSLMNKEAYNASSFLYEPPILRIKAMIYPADLIKRLGGTIKIAAQERENLDENGLLESMEQELLKIKGKIIFGISLYSHETTKVGEWGKMIKRNLKGNGKSVRFVFNNEPILSSVSVEKNKLTSSGKEFLIQKQGNKYSFAVTKSVQPFESFSQRDYGRPGRDSFSGMLPPKLAMMLINLAGMSKEKILMDPFCGSGTILTEAKLLGHDNLLGSDISAKAIEDTKKNLNWATGNENSIRLICSGVEQISKHVDPHSIDAIVTEPYLGKPLKGKEKESDLSSEADELLNIYLEAFKEFKKILRPDGKVVFIIPRLYYGNNWISISDKLVPKIQEVGFKIVKNLPDNISQKPFILYRRTGQFVGREVWSFALTK